MPELLPRKTARTAPSRVTLIAMTAISVLTLNLFLPSLPSMARDFGVSYGAISLAIAGYLLLSAILTLVLGPLADTYGRRPVLLISFAIFTLASAGAALAQDYALFIVFRMVQAVCATGSMLSRAIVRDMYPPGKGTSVLGYIAMAMAVVPMLGPLVGGVLEETLGWRAVFWLFTLLGSACFIMIWIDLGETAPAKKRNASQQIQGYLDVVHSRVFWSYSLVIGFSTGAFFVFLSGAPLVASQVYGLPPSRTGIALGVTAMGFFMGSFVAGRVAERTPIATMIVLGRCVGVVGPLAALVIVLAGYGTPLPVFAMLVTIGIANGISMPAANTGAMSVRPDLAASAAGLSGAIGTAMGAVASALTGAALTQDNGEWLFPLLLLTVCGLALLSGLAAMRAGRTIA